MDQMKLFYNVIHDIWDFCKKELAKPKSEMDDDDWESATNEASNLSKKYSKLGENEAQFFTHVILEFLEYIDRQDKQYVTDENGKSYWVK